MRPDPLPNALRAACDVPALVLSEAEINALVESPESQSPPGFAVWVDGETGWLALPGLDEAIAVQRPQLPLLAAAVAELAKAWAR